MAVAAKAAAARAAVEKEVAALEHSREGMEEARAVRVGTARVGVAKAVEKKGVAKVVMAVLEATAVT